MTHALVSSAREKRRGWRMEERWGEMVHGECRKRLANSSRSCECSYLLALTILFAFLAGCAHQQAYKRGTRLSEEGRYEKAIAELEEAVALAEESDNEKAVQRYREKGKFYGDLKKTLAQHVSAFNAPIIEGFNSPDNTADSVRDFLRDNAEKVTPVALDTVEATRAAMGIGRSLFRA